MLREVAKSEAQPGLNFKKVECGGRTVNSNVQQSTQQQLVAAKVVIVWPARGEGGQEEWIQIVKQRCFTVTRKLYHNRFLKGCA